MWNQMISILEDNLKYEILYFLKHNIKSVNLAKIQNEADLDEYGSLWQDFLYWEENK